MSTPANFKLLYHLLLNNSQVFIAIIHASSWLMRGAVKKLPAIGRLNREETSSKVIVISPNGGWEEYVSLCHHFTKTVNSWPSNIASGHSTSERRSHSSTIALTSHGIGASNNFFNFPLGVGTFSGSRSCNKPSKKQLCCLIFWSSLQIPKMMQLKLSDF